MSRTTNLQTVRRKRKMRNMAMNLLLLVFAIGIALGLVYLNNNQNFKEWVNTSLLGSSKGVGYPLLLPGGTVKKTAELNGRFALLNESKIYAYDGGGNLKIEVKHGAFNPVVKSYGDRTLAYDQGGKTLTLLRGANPLMIQNYTNEIYDADVSRGDVVAVALRGQQYTSEVMVYNSRQEEIFKWSSQNIVVGLDLSSSGDRLTVGCLQGQGGILESIVYVFRFDQGEEGAQVSKTVFSDSLLLDARYQKNGDIKLIFDNKLVCMTSAGKELATYDYQGRTLAAFGKDDSDSSALLSGNYTSDRFLTLTFLNGRCAELGSVEISEDIKGISKSGKNTALLLSQSIEVYDDKAQLVFSSPATDIEKIQLIGNALYYIGKTHLNKVDIHTERDLTARSSSSSIPPGMGSSVEPESSASSSQPASETGGWLSQLLPQSSVSSSASKPDSSSQSSAESSSSSSSADSSSSASSSAGSE